MVSYYVYYTVVRLISPNPPRFKFPRFSSLYQAVSQVALLTEHWYDSNVHCSFPDADLLAAFPDNMLSVIMSSGALQPIEKAQIDNPAHCLIL